MKTQLTRHITVCSSEEAARRSLAQAFCPQVGGNAIIPLLVKLRMLLAVLLAFLWAGSSARAGVAAYSGNIELLASAPTSVETGALESDTYIRVFAEQCKVALTAPLQVDLTTPDTYDNATPTTPGTIPAGAVVNSYFLHLDRMGDVASPSLTLAGTLALDEPILGVIISDANLDDSDFLGTSTYSTGESLRGLKTYGGEDIVTWISPSTIEVELPIYHVTDQIRIITSGRQRNVTFSIDRQSASVNVVAPSFGMGTGTLVAGTIGEGDILTVGTASPGPNPASAVPPPPGVFISSLAFNLGGLPFREVDALSFGRDEPDGRLYFSVDEFARGRNAPPFADLFAETSITEASADVFSSASASPLSGAGPVGVQQVIDGDASSRVGLGLIEPNPPAYTLPDDGDNLDALDIATRRSDRNGFIFFSLDADYGEPLEPFVVIPGVGGGPNYASACALDAKQSGGPGCPNFQGADVLVKTPGVATISVYASAMTLGLGSVAEDDIDALAIYDNGDGQFDPAVDRIYFSLRRMSGTISLLDSRLNIPIEPGDVLTLPTGSPGAPWTPAIAIPAEDLGLRTARSGAPLPSGYADDLNALDFVLDDSDDNDNPNLNVNVQLGAEAAEEGEPFTVTLTVNNIGIIVAAQPVLYGHISATPAGPITVLSNAPSQGSCQTEDGTVTWMIGELTPQATATLQLSLAVAPEFEDAEQGQISFTAEVSAAEIDADPLDNLDEGNLPVWATRDWGDAPEPPYPTTFPNGARHRRVGPFFAGSTGGQRDPDPDGMPSVNADGDDVLADANDDEEGIAFLDPIVPGAVVRVEFNVGLGGHVDAWMDFNGGGWTAAGEQIFTATPVPAGLSIRTFTVPIWATPGTTYARFRISQAGGLPYTGFAPNGEVQDYRLEILPIVVGGLEVEPIGNAELTVDSNQLSIDTSAGEGGVLVHVGGANGWAGKFSGLDHLEAAGSEVEFSLGFGEDLPQVNLQITGTGTEAMLTCDFTALGSEEVEAFAYDDAGRLMEHTVFSALQPLPLPICAEGTYLRLTVVRIINGVAILRFECVRTIEEGLLEIVGVMERELRPKVDTSDPKVIQQILIRLTGHLLPTLLDHAVYHGASLYAAGADSQLQVTENGLTVSANEPEGTASVIAYNGACRLDGSPANGAFELSTDPANVAFLFEPIGLIADSTNDRVTVQQWVRLSSNTDEQLSAELRVLDQEQLELSTDYEDRGITDILFEVYHDSTLVGSATVPSHSAVTLGFSDLIVAAPTASSGQLGFRFKFAQTTTFNIPDGPALTGDEIHAIAVPTENITLEDLYRTKLKVSPGLSIDLGHWPFAYDRGDAPIAASFFDASHHQSDDLIIGTRWDSETRGKASEHADGDDTHNEDDEDGVTFPTTWIEGDWVTVEVETSGGGMGFMHIWVDWDGDGTFAQDDDYVVPGTYDVVANIPADDTYEYEIYVPRGTVTEGGTVSRIMRVRFTSKFLGPDGYSGCAPDGEVEDHEITIGIDPGLDEDDLPDWMPIGQATSEYQEDSLLISNLGDSFQDGIGVNLPNGPGAYRMGIEPLVFTGPDQGIRFTALGQLPGWSDIGSLGLITLGGTGDVVQVSADFSALGASEVEVELYLHGNLVHSMPVTGDSIIGEYSLPDGVAEFGVNTSGGLSYSMRLTHPTLFLGGDAPLFDELVVRPAGVGSGGSGTPTGFVLQAALTARNLNALRILRSTSELIPLRLHITPTPAGLELAWPSKAGTLYDVEMCDALGQGATWTSVATVPGAAGSSFTTHTVSVDHGVTARFYRVVIP